jgi:hypothetical protein
MSRCRDRVQTLTSPGSPECIRVPPPKNQKNNNTGTSHRASAFAPKIVARARRGVGAATGETPPTAETAPTDETPRTDVTAPKELPAGEAPAAAARRAPNLTSRRLDDAPSTAPSPAAARAVPPAVPSTQLRAPAATDPHANPNLPRTLEHEARLRAAMPPPPSVPPSAPPPSRARRLRPSQYLQRRSPRCVRSLRVLSCVSGTFSAYISIFSMTG